MFILTRKSLAEHPPPEPRRGGLFVANARTISSFFLFFGGAANHNRGTKTKTLPISGSAATYLIRAAEKQKERGAGAQSLPLGAK